MFAANGTRNVGFGFIKSSQLKILSFNRVVFCCVVDSDAVSKHLKPSVKRYFFIQILVCGDNITPNFL